ncbi:MAG: amino acid permease [Alphaproteobacteria bacterium]|nr:amino acid permease [Alphaproteobacteria bacterium]OJV14178.1 MAG: hypothetical protein BGO27_01610 [Alphaproteobacteria bacterium 33-17]
MNQRLIGSICLIAGTSIGAGMIALPIMLAKIGLFESIMLMILIWAIMYYSALASVELNLRAGKGITLGEAGAIYSGQIASKIGTISLKILSYSLLSAYLYAGCDLIKTLTGYNPYILEILAVLLIIVLTTKIRLIEYINRILFLAMLCVLGLIIIYMIPASSLHNSGTETTLQLSTILGTIPVIFTSFGFQVIFHTVTDYCNKDARLIRKAFYWGSLIPLLVYTIWTLGILNTIASHNPDLYVNLIKGNVEIGTLINELSIILNKSYLNNLVWVISILAITTSMIGVSVGLSGSISNYLNSKNLAIGKNNLIAALSTVLPGYIVAKLAPNAFIAALGFAGMILVVIAIFLPMYLLYKSDKVSGTYYYNCLSIKSLRYIAIGFGILVTIIEVKNLI